MNSLIINTKDFNNIIQKLRIFFISEGFLEVHTQNRLSILAACEDPETISTFNYINKVWPLPQTGQMWLEYELLKDQSVPGYFCVSTSYRNEPNPIEGRHHLIFPMFEFEMKGDMNDMIKLEKKLLIYLGYNIKDEFPEDDYSKVAQKYNTHELEHEHEIQLYNDYGSVFFLKNFPSYTSPFWNMKKNKIKNEAYKVDVILSGQETIGSAERSCNPTEMLNDFNTISNGKYAQTIYDHFGKERVQEEMKEFLNNKFFPRSGGGIGITRLIRSMKMENIL